MKSSRKHGGKIRYDRIGSLPDELVTHILSFLPTRCAVSTSILSKRWRYLFTLTDCLSFDDKPCFVFTKGDEKIDIAQTERFKEFVYKVLQSHQISPIKKFSLVCRGACKKSDLNAWVCNAVQKGVQELHYKVIDDDDDYFCKLPDGLLICETLVRLELNCCGCSIKIPLSASLPSLKILHLDSVFFDQFSMQRLFSSSKMLEELTLYSCGSYGNGNGIISTRRLKVLRIEKCNFKDDYFMIDAPNLAYLIYNCNVYVKIAPSWKYSCSLVKAELNFDWTEQALHYYSRYSLEYDREIFKIAAYKTTKLSLFSDSVEILLKFVDQEQMPEFHSLSKLLLCRFSYDSWKYVTSLLDKSPQLETLIFNKGLVHCSCCHPTSPPSESLLLPFSCNAQVIEVHNFCGHEGSLLLLIHLLRNARFLKKLIVRRCPCSSDRKIKEQINKDVMMNLPRASSNCCIELI